MEIRRELGKDHDEVIYKDALVVELSRAGIPFLREKNYEITYKRVVLLLGQLLAIREISVSMILHS
jgi:GxxExxY protein